MSAGLSFAEDWTTTDGTTYQGVKVVRVEDDAITILYKDGGALVPLVKLPPALQEKFSYDPQRAKAAADARSKEDAANSVLLQKEIEASAKMKHDQQVKDANTRYQTNVTK